MCTSAFSVVGFELALFPEIEHAANKVVLLVICGGFAVRHRSIAACRVRGRSDVGATIALAEQPFSQVIERTIPVAFPPFY